VPLPALTAQAAYLIDADTNTVLFNQKGEQSIMIASTSKIMTAYLAVTKVDPTNPVRIAPETVTYVKHYIGGSSAGLQPNDSLTVEDLLYAMMLPSGNDAAMLIAQAVGITEEGFVAMMNREAGKIGLSKNTHFQNPEGSSVIRGMPNSYQDNYNTTTAADLVKLSRLAMANPLFATIVKRPDYPLPDTLSPAAHVPAGTLRHHAYNWLNDNTLLAPLGGYEGATGIKTGANDLAGYSFAFAATRPIRCTTHLIGVVLQSDSGEHRFTDARALLDYGFSTLSAQSSS